MANFVVTLTTTSADQPPRVQTFTFDGTKSLDEVFAAVEEKNRFVESMFSLVSGKPERVYGLSVHRDQSEDNPGIREGLVAALEENFDHKNPSPA